MAALKDKANPGTPPDPPKTETPPTDNEQQTKQQNAASQASGSGDDDSGKKSAQNTGDGTPSSAAPQTQPTPNSAAQPTNAGTSPSAPQSPAPPPVTPAPNAGTTVPGKAETSSAAQPAQIPGKRTYNPLSTFSSYTYQLSLYMITPDAYDLFIASGRRDLNVMSNTGGNAAATESVKNSGG